MIKTIKIEKAEDCKILSMTLPKDTFVTVELIEDLYRLFQMTSASHLKRSISDIFFSYIIHTSVENFKDNFQETATDFYFLLQFLETVNGRNNK